MSRGCSTRGGVDQRRRTARGDAILCTATELISSTERQSALAGGEGTNGRANALFASSSPLLFPPPRDRTGLNLRISRGRAAINRLSRARLTIDHGDVIARSADIQSGEVIRKIVFKTWNASLSSGYSKVYSGEEEGDFFFFFSGWWSIIGFERKRRSDVAYRMSLGKFDTEGSCVRVCRRVRVKG